MYESTFENVKSSFQPLIELAELNRKTLEKITSVQTSYLTDCISSGIKQVKTLAESGSPQRAAELSFEMIKEFESKLTGATEQNLAALAELRAAYSSLVNGNCSGSYARIAELYNLKDAFVNTGLTVSTTAAKLAVVEAAPAKQATVKKTPAKAAAPAPEAVAKVQAKPVVAVKPAAPAVEVKIAAPAADVKTAPVVETKAAPAVKVAPAVDVKPAAVVEAKVAPVADVKAAPVVKAKPAAVKSAPVAVAEKAPVKRAAAKPTLKKSTAKPVAKKS